MMSTAMSLGAGRAAGDADKRGGAGDVADEPEDELGDSDSHAQGYYVLRSDNGGSFATVAKITSGKTLTYTDAAAVSGHSYRYEVESKGLAGTSAPSKASEPAKTPLACPVRWRGRCRVPRA